MDFNILFYHDKYQLILIEFVIETRGLRQYFVHQKKAFPLYSH